MENRSHALIAIAFLIVFGVGAGLVAWWMLAPTTARVPYLLESHASVAGLGPGSPVNYQGVQVGAVRKIRLDPANRRQVDVLVAVDEDFPLPEGTYTTISSQGLIGNKAIELTLGRGNKIIKTSAKSPAHLPLKQGSLAGLMSQATDIVAEIKGTLHAVKKLLSDENRSRISDTLANIQKASARLDRLEKDVQPSVRAMPEVLRDTRLTLVKVRGLLARANRLIASAHGPVRAIGKAASSTGAVVAQFHQVTVPQLDALLEQLQRLSTHLEALTSKLQRTPQSLILGPTPTRPGPGETAAGAGRSG